MSAAELRTQGLLDATSDSVATDPQKATEFARGVASQVHTLPSMRQRSFLRALRKGFDSNFPPMLTDALSEMPCQAWQLLELPGIYSPWEITFSAQTAHQNVEPRWQAYRVAAHICLLRRDQGSPRNSSVNMLELRSRCCSRTGEGAPRAGTRGTPRTPTTLDGESIALATQLAWWAKTNAPEHSSTLDSLLAAQPDLLGIGEILSDFREHVELMDSVPSLEEELASTIDETSKSRLRFQLCMNRIRNGKFSQAEDLLDDLKPELRRTLRDFIRLQRASEMIANDSLEAATIEVAGLKDSLHQVLGGLSLASTYWSRSIDATNGSEEDREAADRALRPAIGATEGVPDHLRPHARIAVAAVLAKCDQGEEALRVLELALQELGTDQSRDETEEESMVSVTVSPWGRFWVEITDGHAAVHQYLHPRNLNDANFEQAIHRLSLSPAMDLDRLDAVASMAVQPRMRAEGLVAVATGALAKAFNTETE